jgi:hypothetical protein
MTVKQQEELDSCFILAYFRIRGAEEGEKCYDDPRGEVKGG